MYLSIYIEINIICLFILAMIVRKKGDNVGLQKEVQDFRKAVFSVVFILLLDSIWILGEYQIISTSPLFGALINAIYMADTGLIGYLWLEFTQTKLDTKFLKHKKWQRILLAAPCILLTVLSLASIFTGWIFFIDGNNIYHRGSLYSLQLILAYFYLAAALTETVYCAYRAKNGIEQKNAVILLYFVALPILGGILQTVFYGLPVVWPAATVSFLMVFINLQETKISTDVLTGLNNRRRAEEFLSNRILNLPRNNKVIFYLIDINRFKRINDRFGHNEGDNALMLVSDVLRNTANYHDVFLARAGGDEFWMIWVCPLDTNPKVISNEINDSFKMLCHNSAIQYELSVSIGYSECAKAGTNIKSIINEADRMLYKEKEIAHRKKNSSSITIEGR